MPNNVIQAVDLFCGAGGTSSGLAKACTKLGRQLKLLAVNHWPVAVETHAQNHPWADHICEDIDNVNPRKVVPKRRLDLLVASPECMHHSNARGGKPMNDQSRATAWHVLRWAEALYIKHILIENVPEFRSWGPLGCNGRPLKSRKGELFQLFIQSLEALGYRVAWQIVNSANCGDPTSRRRLFIMATRGRRKLRWPEHTHSEKGDNLISQDTQPWRSAREIIDWDTPGKSIFTRKRPLADATIDRIAAGLKKFGGKSAEPFLVMLYGTGKARSIDRPCPTITGSGQHIGLCEPFLVKGYKGSDAQSLDRPLPTVCANFEHLAICEPFLVMMYGQSKAGSLKRPLPTITGCGKLGLVEPFLIQVNHGTPLNELFRRAKSIHKPLPTLTAKNGLALIEPFLVKYNKTGSAHSVDKPIDTITGKDRFALVQTSAGPAFMDIRFRMLQPHELAAAMSFDSNFKFSGNRSQQVKQIGNAVPVKTAQALCEALIG